ncbi:MAG: nicotinate-nucleotide adenylyltransferase [Pirellulaceae bacterium]
MTDGGSRQRIGLFGGTFDPIHIGHLFIAEQVREYLQLDQVRFVPAAIAPHKQDQRTSDAKHRLEMIRLAIGGNAFFAWDDCELKRGGTSYTVDTLAEFRSRMPEADLVFVMGNDSLEDLHTWREPQRICELAFVAVVARGGQAAPDLTKLAAYLPDGLSTPAEELQKHLVPIPQIEFSSSDIRQRLVDGRSIRYQIHPAVEAYIHAQRLYQA